MKSPASRATDRSDTAPARALFLVHDDDTDRGIADTGTLRDHVAERGYEIDIVHPSDEFPDVTDIRVRDRHGFRGIGIRRFRSLARRRDRLPSFGSGRQRTDLRRLFRRTAAEPDPRRQGQTRRDARTRIRHHGHRRPGSRVPRTVDADALRPIHPATRRAGDRPQRGCAAGIHVRQKPRCPVPSRRSHRRSGQPGRPVGPPPARDNWWSNAASTCNGSPPRSPPAPKNPGRTAASSSTRSSHSPERLV